MANFCLYIWIITLPIFGYLELYRFFQEKVYTYLFNFYERFSLQGTFKIHYPDSRYNDVGSM